MSCRKVSIICPSVRPNLWGNFISSIRKNKCNYEIIFIGNESEHEITDKNVFVYKSDLEFAPCISIGFEKSTGDVIHWTTDDLIYEEGSIDCIFDFFNRVEEKKIAVAVREKRMDGSEVTFEHTLKQNYNVSSGTLLAFGAMRKDYFKELGGVDKRFTGTEWENDMSLRILQDGGSIVILDGSVVYSDHTVIHPNGSPVKKTLERGKELIRELWIDEGRIVKRKNNVESYDWIN